MCTRQTSPPTHSRVHTQTPRYVLNTVGADGLQTWSESGGSGCRSASSLQPTQHPKRECGVPTHALHLSDADVRGSVRTKTRGWVRAQSPTHALLLVHLYLSRVYRRNWVSYPSRRSVGYSRGSAGSDGISRGNSDSNRRVFCPGHRHSAQPRLIRHIIRNGWAAS